MNKLEMKIVTCLLLLGIKIVTFSQTKTFDYINANLSTSNCNVFNVSPAVTIDGIEHNSWAGGVTFNSTLGLGLGTEQKNAPFKSTAFVINYPFQSGFNYNIKITAKGNPDVILKSSVVPNVANFVTNGQSACGLDQFAFLYTTAGAGQLTQYVTNSSTEYTVPQFSIPSGSSSYNYLFIWSSGGNVNLDLDVLYISKITITPTAIVNPVSFTLPGTTSFACGSNAAINFTVNNVYGSTGVTNYTWNLGATPNGWLLNNAAAPATFSTNLLNTITLTPACNTVPKNISATVTANNNTYNTNTSNILVTQPNMSISGVSSFCSGTSTYSITDLPCSSSVAWIVSPAGIVTPTASTATSPSFTQTGNGNISLSATVTSCGVVQPAITKAVHVGGYTSADYTMTGGSSSIQPLYWCPNQTYGFSVNGSGSNYVWTVPTGWSINYQSNYLCVLKAPATSSPPTGTVYVSFTEPCGSQITKSFFTAYSSSACAPDPRFTFAPNPAPSYLNVAVASGYTSTVSIKRIQIVRVSTGLVVFDQSYGSGVLNAYISTSSFSTGNYNLLIYDGTAWVTYQFTR